MLCPSCGSSVGNEVKLCKECQERKDIADAEAEAAAEGSGPRLPLEASSSTREAAELSATQVALESQSDSGAKAVSGRSSTARSAVKDKADSFEFFGYAGFWLRALAFLFDTSLLLLVLHVASSVFPTKELAEQISALGTEAGYALGAVFGSTVFFVAFLSAIAFGLVSFLFSQFIVGWFYHAVFESSDHGGTIGKALLGLRVCDVDGNALTFFEASSRHLAKILSYLTLYLGFVIAGFTSHRQALHDIVAGAVVIKRTPTSPLRVLAAVLCAVLFLILASPSRQHVVMREQPRVSTSRHVSKAPNQSSGFRAKTDGIVQVGAVNERLQGVAALYNPKDNHAYFFFYQSALSPSEQGEIKRDPSVETAFALLPDVLIRLRFRRGLTACDPGGVEQMQVRLLEGKAALPLQTQFNFAGVLADKLSLNCRLNDGAIFLAEFNAIAKSPRQQIRWDIESNGYLYFTESLAEIPLEARTSKR